MTEASFHHMIFLVHLIAPVQLGLWGQCHHEAGDPVRRSILAVQSGLDSTN